MKFRSKAAGYILGVRFYKGPSNTGTHSGHLWTNAGKLLATVNFANETASGWQQANFSTPVAITANTTYVVSYRAPNGRYSVNEGHFASGVDRGPLSALRDGQEGGNGVYRYGTTGFPTNTYRSSNYWVDVVFNTAATTAPRPVPASLDLEPLLISESTLSSADRAVEVAAATAEKATESSVLIVHTPEVLLAKPGETVGFVVTAQDPAGLPVEITASDLPTGASFDAATSRLEWTPAPNQEGEYAVSFRAINSAGQSGQSRTRVMVGSGQPVIAKSAQVACSPGSIGVLDGGWLAEEEMSDGTGASRELGGARVRVNGLPMPVLNASPTRVEFQCPDSAVGSALSISVETALGATKPIETTMREAAQAPPAASEDHHKFQ